MNIEFSKLIIFCISSVAFALTVFTMVMVWNTNDTTALSYLIPSVFTALAASTGFYYNKAKLENQIKLRKKYGSEIYNDAKGGSDYE